MYVCVYLLVEDHMHSVGFDVNGVLSHELQDVLDGGRVGQASEADTVARAACGHERGRGQDRHGHHRRLGQRGDQGGRHVAVQHLEHTRARGSILVNRDHFGV